MIAFMNVWIQICVYVDIYVNMYIYVFTCMHSNSIHVYTDIIIYAMCITYITY
jgi:hypothetical protein